MAEKRSKLSYITVPSQIIRKLSLQSFLLVSLNKSTAAGSRTTGGSTTNTRPRLFSFRNPRFLLQIILLFLITLLTFTLVSHLDFDFDSPCGDIVARSSSSSSEGEGVEFWKQPDGMGYRPCLEFSSYYSGATDAIMRNRRKYLIVVVNGGLNQQRNQIVDAVVIARILGAALVVPVMQVNMIWGDFSEFPDIFDWGHFKKVLADDVRIVSTLPASHIGTTPVEETRTPLHASPEWIRSSYLNRLNIVGVLLLRGIDSRLSKDLSPDLQKLRCKVAFEALRFSPAISEIGNKFAERMRSKGPYLALHLRLERDVWVRTGCFPGLSQKYDEIIREERIHKPRFLTGRTKLTFHARKVSGLCPLTSVEVTRFLKAMDAPRNTRIYWAGGEPFGGEDALRPLMNEFPFLYNKENISLPGELTPFANRSSVLAAIDYIVSEKSDIFMQSHGGNMGRALQGHRTYGGHKKNMIPNKRQMIKYFLNTTMSETEFNSVVKKLHIGPTGLPEIRKSRHAGQDVTAYPIPECMCSTSDINRVAPDRDMMRR